MTTTATETKPETKKPDPFKQEFYQIVDTFPAKYRDFTLTNLKPSEASRLPLDEQQKLYDELRANPLAGWAFFAPAGYSKTTCSYALYRRSVQRNLSEWWPRQNEIWSWEMRRQQGWVIEPEAERLKRRRFYVWRKSVPDLIQQHLDTFNYSGVGDRPNAPDITVEKIEEGVRRGFMPRVFLEEIDKVKPSEFVINQIFRLFDVIDRHKCQLVMDTNLSKQQFMDFYGEPIARRVKENCIVKEWGF